MKNARDELAESVFLAVLDENRPLFIARAEAEHILSTGVRIGAHLPAYCSATGRVLLGQFADAEIARRIGRKPFPQRTPHTITRLAPLLAEIQAVRKRGYAISDQELELGMCALAVPVTGGSRDHRRDQRQRGLGARPRRRLTQPFPAGIAGPARRRSA